MKNESYNTFIFSISSIFENIFGNVWWYSLIHEKNINKSSFFLNYINNKKVKYSFALSRSVYGALKKYLTVLYLKFSLYRSVDIKDEKYFSVKYLSDHLSFLKETTEIIIPQKIDYKELKYRQLAYNIVCIYNFITLFDFVEIFFRYWYVLSCFIIYKRFLCWRLKFNGEQFLGCDANTFLKRDFYRSFAGDVLMEGLMYEYVFSNLKKRALSAKKIVYVYEGLAWEKALCLQFRDTKVETVGLVCSAVHRNVLNFFYSRLEVNTMPVPKRLGVLGEFQKQQFNMYKNVFVYGAGRYSHLKDIKSNCLTSSIEKNKSILVVLSYDNSNNEALLKFVKSALGSTYNIRILKHPKAKPIPPKIDYYQTEKRKIVDVVNEYNIIICSGDTSFVFTAFVYGKLIVCPVIKGQLILNPLLENKDTELEVLKDPMDLKCFVNKVYQFGYSRIYNWSYHSRNKNRKMILNKYFDFVTNEEMNRRIFDE